MLIIFLFRYRALVLHYVRGEVSRWRPGQKHQAAGHNRQHVINRRLRVLLTCPEWLRLSPGLPSPAEAGLWQLTQGSRYGSHHARSLETYRGESATKIVKFFAAHTVNCVTCKNLTRIEWMWLNFTLVSHSAELSPTGPKLWEIILRSWQVELSTWAVKIRNQPTQKRSCFWYRKLCAFNLLTWGG